MWSIGDMKSKAWSKLKIYYWHAVLVSFIYMLFNGGMSGGRGNGGGHGGEHGQAADYLGLAPRGSSSYQTVILLLGISGALIIVFALFQIFVSNPIEVGKNRFYMESRAVDRSAGIGRALWVFGSGHYMNVVKVMFLRDLFTVLWTFLLIIPGIVKSYEYSMIAYILSENPDAHYKDAFALSKDMMTGNKFQLFLLQLSFIGWYFGIAVLSRVFLFSTDWLGYIASVIGSLMLCPYVEAATAEVYAFLRSEISGYPFNGFGVPEPEDSPYFGEENGRDFKEESAGSAQRDDYYDSRF